MKLKLRRKQGFTLVEIMIVVVIIGLLAVMAIPAFNQVRRTSQRNAVVNNLRQISNAADQFFLQNGAVQVNMADIVGPDLFIKALNPVAGENYAGIFPIAAGHGDLVIVVPGLDNENVVYAQ